MSSKKKLGGSKKLKEERQKWKVLIKSKSIFIQSLMNLSLSPHNPEEKYYKSLISLKELFIVLISTFIVPANVQI